MNVRTVEAPQSVWRVGRAPDPLVGRVALSREELGSPSAGSRFDDPLGDYPVHYFGDDLTCCYVETLARFRPDPGVVAFIKDEWEDESNIVIGGVPAEWRQKRVAVRVSLADTFPFLDLTATETQQRLRLEMAELLAALGYRDLDAAAIQGADRRITRWISRWAHEARNSDGEYIYGGIKYLSRLGSEHVCWAVFDGADIREQEKRPLLRTDPAMQEVATKFGLVVF